MKKFNRKKWAELEEDSYLVLISQKFIEPDKNLHLFDQPKLLSTDSTVATL